MRILIASLLCFTAVSCFGDEPLVDPWDRLMRVYQAGYQDHHLQDAHGHGISSHGQAEHAHGEHGHHDPLHQGHGHHDHGQHCYSQHDHGHHPGHMGHVDFDRIVPYESHSRGVGGAHGHSGHTSIEGYPFVHGIRTEIDFVERALEMDLVHSRDADDGAVNEWEYEAELVWAFNSRFIFIFGTPLIFLDPDVGSNTTGIGDLEIGFQFLAFGGERDLLFTSLIVGVPTGDADRDLGSGFSVLEPTVLYLHDYGGGTYAQSRFAWELPISVTGVCNEFRYDTGLFHTFICTEDWRMLRYFTPILEVNGVTKLNGNRSSETVVDLTSGVRWIVRELDEVGIGGSFPVTGTQNFDWQMLVSYRLHF